MQDEQRWHEYREDYHVNPKTKHVIEVQGQVAVWKAPHFRSAVKTGTGKKPIYGFSAKSRFAMLKFINSIDLRRCKVTLMITLTYPDSIGITSYKQTGSNRSRFWRYVEEHLGRPTAGIWKMEWEARKSGEFAGKPYPHFHILVFDTSYIPYHSVNEWWRACLGYPENVRTEVRGIKRGDNVMAYVGKYAAKPSGSLVIEPTQNTPPTGKQWGIFRKSLIATCQTEAFTVEDEEVLERLRQRHPFVKQWMDQYGNRSFTVLGEAALILRKFLLQNAVDGTERDA